VGRLPVPSMSACLLAAAWDIAAAISKRVKSGGRSEISIDGQRKT
jgi:hypothetical protein